MTLSVPRSTCRNSLPDFRIWSFGHHAPPSPSVLILSRSITMHSSATSVFICASNMISMFTRIKCTVPWRSGQNYLRATATATHHIVHFNCCKVYTQEYRTAAKRSWAASCSTLASSAQRTTIVNNSFRPSHSIYNSWQHRRWDDGRVQLTTAAVWRQVEQQAVLISAHSLYLMP